MWHFVSSGDFVKFVLSFIDGRTLFYSSSLGVCVSFGKASTALLATTVSTTAMLCYDAAPLSCRVVIM